MNTTHQKILESVDSRREEIEKNRALIMAVRKLHTKNPNIYHKFEAEALKLAALGRTKYGAKTIIEFIRHETALRSSADQFKVNNNLAPYYSRLFAHRYPRMRNIFAFRKSIFDNHYFHGSFDYVPKEFL